MNKLILLIGLIIIFTLFGAGMIANSCKDNGVDFDLSLNVNKVLSVEMKLNTKANDE